jgi:hypothetical protein
MNTNLTTLIGESEELVHQLLAQADELAAAIEAEVTTKRQLRDAEQALSEAEAGYVVEAEMQAQEKKGRLAGIAKSSAAYKAACETLIAEAHRNGLHGQHAQVTELRQAADSAQIAREQHAARFTALKYVAELRTAMLNALNS